MDPLPSLATEQEEADWWHANPEEFAERFAAGAIEGRVRRLSQTTLPGAEPSVVRLRAEVMARARKFAAKRGLPYQDYMRQLLHDALDNEEKILASA